MTFDLTSRPRLASGCRVAQVNNQRILQRPEGILPLRGPSMEIVSRCDGKHTVQQIISQLQTIYAKAQPEKVEQDVLGYLALLQEQHALDFES